LLLASVVPAGAQQMVAPPSAPLMWDNFQGFYVGANVGGGFGDTTATNNVNGNVSKPRLDLGGALGGVQGGYNWKVAPNWLVGLETDFDGSGLTSDNGARSRTFPNGSVLTGNLSRNEQWIGTVRGRVGYEITPDWAYFLTGGFAYAQVNNAASALVTGVPVAGVPGGATVAFNKHPSGVETGYAVGTTTEYKVAPGWGVTFGYLYTDLGTLSYNVPVRFASAAGTFNNHVSVDNNAHLFRVGVNYHFGTPPAPPPPMVSPALPPAAPKVFIVFFDWDKDSITREGQQIIIQAADAYKAGAPVQIQVTGYTDRSGSPGYNQRLSERRANNVARAMAALGVPKEQMIVSGRGENDNRVPTANGVREPQNRRVEIVSP
jgi:OOP family OmpA-OmpF porin